MFCPINGQNWSVLSHDQTIWISNSHTVLFSDKSSVCVSGIRIITVFLFSIFFSFKFPFVLSRSYPRKKPPRYFPMQLDFVQKRANTSSPLSYPGTPLSSWWTGNRDTLCWVFWPVNGCFARRMKFNIVFFRIFTSFLEKLGKNWQKKYMFKQYIKRVITGLLWCRIFARSRPAFGCQAVSKNST